MAKSVKFIKTTQLPTDLEQGGIYFDNKTHTIVLDDNTPYGSRIKNISIDENDNLIVEHWDNEGDISKHLASEEYTKISYFELKKLKERNELLIGHKYRITDYEFTTTVSDTKSAKHPFDIVVEAVDVNKFSEDAKAMVREGDTYFEDCNLESWDLKYCFDNDTSRFAWVQPNSIETTVRSIESVDLTGFTLNRTETFNRFPTPIIAEYFRNDDTLEAENYVKTDNYIAFGYATTPTQSRVPMIFKQNRMYCQHLYDIDDPYVYVGTEDIDGVTYDKWGHWEDSQTARIGQGGGDYRYNASIPDTFSYYIYTLPIVRVFGDTKVITSGALQTTIKFYTIPGGLPSEYTQVTDAYSDNTLQTEYNPKYTFVELATVSIGQTLQTVLLYKEYWEDNSMDYFECHEFVGTSEIEGQTYDVWKRLAIGSDDEVWYRNSYTRPLVTATYNEKEVGGTGVIYYLKDQFGNEAPYDFKNLLYRVDDLNYGLSWKYTFNYNHSPGNPTQDATSEPFYKNSPLVQIFGEYPWEGLTADPWKNNVIKPYYRNKQQQLNWIYLDCRNDYNGDLQSCSYNNHFEEDCHNISITHTAIDTSFGKRCNNISVKYGAVSSKVGDDCRSCQLYGNFLIGNGCTDITCTNSTNFVMGNYNKSITFNGGYDIVIGNYNSAIKFEKHVYDVKIGDHNLQIYLHGDTYKASIGNNNKDITGAMQNSCIHDNCTYLKFRFANHSSFDRSIYIFAERDGSSNWGVASVGLYITRSNFENCEVIRADEIYNSSLSRCRYFLYDVRTKLIRNVIHDCSITNVYETYYSCLKSCTINTLNQVLLGSMYHCLIENLKCVGFIVKERVDNSSDTHPAIFARSSFKNITNVLMGVDSKGQDTIYTMSSTDVPPYTNAYETIIIENAGMVPVNNTTVQKVDISQHYPTCKRFTGDGDAWQINNPNFTITEFVEPEQITNFTYTVQIKW